MCGSSEDYLRRYIRQREDTGETGLWPDPDVHPSLGLDELRKEASGCLSCGLGKTRLNACFGNGSYSARLMFIGEGPGYDEDHCGEVFIGRAGQLLNKIIETTLGMKREDVFVTNIVKCHPMKDPSDPEKRGNDRPPSEKELAACIGKFLYRQIEIIRPVVIVPLGSPAAKTILGTSETITSLRGKPRKMRFGDYESVVVPTYHPAYLLRSPSKKREVFEDIKLVRSIL